MKERDPVEEFHKYWSTLVKDSKSMSFDGSERISIQLFYDWLTSHYVLVPK